MIVGRESSWKTWKRIADDEMDCKLDDVVTSVVFWVLNTPEIRLRTGLGRKRISGVVRAQGTCRLAANVVLPSWGANSTPPLAGFSLRGGKERGKGGKGREGTEGTGAALKLDIYTTSQQTSSKAMDSMQSCNTVVHHVTRSSSRTRNLTLSVL